MRALRAKQVADDDLETRGLTKRRLRVDDVCHKGLVYTERLYREPYHAYDWDDSWHVTEIQIEIE